MKDNDYAYFYYPSRYRITRTLEDSKYSFAALLYHELAHANDFFPSTRWLSYSSSKTVYDAVNEVYQARQIESAVNWAKENDLKIIIVGGADSWRLTDLLVKNNIPVIVDKVEKVPFRRFEQIHLPYKIPYLLKQGGVQFCINTRIGYPHDGNVRNLPNEAMRAAAYGLEKAEALRSITLSAAEILGIDEMVGSLDIGKDATFFISDKAPMEMFPKVLMAFIQGREVDLNDLQKMHP